jgi:hypothetical protein
MGTAITVWLAGLSIICWILFLKICLKGFCKED